MKIIPHVCPQKWQGKKDCELSSVFQSVTDPDCTKKYPTTDDVDVSVTDTSQFNHVIGIVSILFTSFRSWRKKAPKFAARPGNWEWGKISPQKHAGNPAPENWGNPAAEKWGNPARE